MKKSLLIILVLALSLLTSCTIYDGDEKAACDLYEDCGEEFVSMSDFKADYEALNGLKNKNDKDYREVTIPEDNPIVYSNGEAVESLVNSHASFYLYVGDPLCPWCRSVIEMALKVAKEKGIKKIYYIDIWDDEGNETFRDKYQITDGELELIYEGQESYHKLITDWADFLKDYTLEDDEGVYDIGEKRIFAPSFFYVEKGELKKFVEGTSDLQKGAYDYLSEEILKDEEEIFNEFFSN